MFYGKDRGCEFLYGGCNSSVLREFCNPKEYSYCSYSYDNKGYCASDSLADGCNYVQPYKNADCQDAYSTSFREKLRGETWGPGSKCVIGSIMEKKYPSLNNEYSLCYKFTCTQDLKVIFYPQNGTEIVCSTKGEKITATGAYKGYLVCPDPKEYCRDYYQDCPNSCSFKGYCNNGVCTCRAGYYT